jgi:hypothetical protein
MSPRDLRETFRRLDHLRSVSSNSAYTSVRPYALKSKRRWMPTPVGIVW